jgi:hypothetical protein
MALHPPHGLNQTRPRIWGPGNGKRKTEYCTGGRPARSWGSRTPGFRSHPEQTLLLFLCVPLPRTRITRFELSGTTDFSLGDQSLGGPSYGTGIDCYGLGYVWFFPRIRSFTQRVGVFSSTHTESPYRPIFHLPTYCIPLDYSFLAFDSQVRQDDCRDSRDDDRRVDERALPRHREHVDARGARREGKEVSQED